MQNRALAEAAGSCKSRSQKIYEALASPTGKKVVHQKARCCIAIKETLPAFRSEIISPGVMDTSSGLSAVTMALSASWLSLIRRPSALPAWQKWWGSARETGQQRVSTKNAGKNRSACFLYVRTVRRRRILALKGITREYPGRVPFFGGSAADNATAGEWLLEHDENVYADRISVAFIRGHGGVRECPPPKAYRETTNVGVITKIRGTPRKSTATRLNSIAHGIGAHR